MSIELKQKPNGIFYIDVEVPDGKGGTRRSRIGFGTRDREDAQAQRRDWLAGVHPKHPAMGGVVAPKGREASPTSSVRSSVDTPYVSSWLARCLSEEEVWRNCRAMDTHRSNVRILTRLLPSDLEIGQLTTQHVKDLDKALRDDHGYAPASRRKLLGSLSAAARFAVDEGVLPSLPKFPKITVDNQKDRVVSLDEEGAMFEAILQRRSDEPLRAWWHFEKLAIVLLDSGCRLTEALLAGPSWVKRKRWTDQATGQLCEGVWLAIPAKTIYEGREITVTKNGKPRDIPLTGRALSIIPELNERAEGTRWFPWKKGSSSPLYHLQNIRADMKERGFMFDDVVLHTFRHTCATRLAEGGLDLVGLRDWLGHSDIKITAARYLHLMNGHIYRGAAILDNYGSLGSVGGNPDGGENNLSKGDPQPTGNNRADSVTHALQ